MKIRPGCAQQIGSRKEQQDSFAFSHLEDAGLVKRAGILAVVADGMGGMAMGRESGAATVKAVLAAHAAALNDDSPVQILHKAVTSANEEVLAMACNANVEGEAGSTLVALIIKDNSLYWTSVGDSRIYLYRSGELVKLTSEHNFEATLMLRVVDGELSREETLIHPDRAGLTNFIGNPDLKSADASLHPFPILNGDWLILCSDGLFGTLNDDEIMEELYGNPNDACERLVKKTVAKDKPHQDNVTVAILACGDKEPVTVRIKKREDVEIYQPLLVKRRNKLPILILAVLSLLIIAVVAGYLLLEWKRKPRLNPPFPATPNHSSSKSAIQKQNTSAKQPKLPAQPAKQDKE